MKLKGRKIFAIPMEIVITSSSTSTIHNVMYSKKPFHMSLNDGLAFFSPSLARWKIIGDCEEDEMRGWNGQ
jgi:hypothetical protein